MKKLKELWGNNKVLIVLGIILIICLIAIITVTFSFFLGGNKGVYGDRLNGIDKHPVTNNIKSEYKTSLESEKSVTKVSIDTKGKIIYIIINFASDTSLEDAKNLAASSIEKLNEDILSFYDIDFTLKCEKSENSEGFTILGAKNVAGSGLIWNNNTPLESEE
ncbi:hypothetical protein EGP99_00880 [bacterium]|jgi:hypothetical protein|nr:hypothetical protein [bacterium]